MQNTLREITDEARAIYQQAEMAGRDLTPKERGKVEELMAAGQELKQSTLREKVFGARGVPELLRGDGSPSVTFGSPGEQFVQSAGFKRIADPGARGQTYTTGAVDVGSFKGGTIYESGQGAGLIPVPQVHPGVVEKLFAQLGVADVIPSTAATTSSVRYINEGTATNAAAGVPEGGEKPASDLAYSTVDEPIKKIATVVTMSDEILDDATNVQTFVNSRLTLFVKIEEERQLLRGAGTNELVGIIGRSGDEHLRAGGPSTTTRSRSRR